MPPVVHLARFTLALLVCLTFAEHHSAYATTLPAGFTETTISGLPNPTAMEIAPDGRIFVCLQSGQLRVIKNGALLPAPFLSLTVDSTGERGLLGIAFDPNFQSNNFIYAYYTADTSPRHNRVSRFTANGDVVVPGSEVPILDLENLSATNHNGGAIHFGPDGKLYVAIGDNANGANSQTLNNRLGKMLRINPDGSIPSDNPFFNTATGLNRSIWALGLRNPFTFAFQPGSGRMFINDVGQLTWEEINDGIAGSNYGWPDTEGETSNPNFRTPLLSYGHGNTETTGCAIAGGTFYNPTTTQFPGAYVGKYFFADLCGSWIRVFDPLDNSASGFATNVPNPVDLKVGADGALYYLSIGVAAVVKIEFPANKIPPTVTGEPSDQSVAQGQSATFSVTASGSTPLNYQWQRNGVDIPGATSSTYTLSGVTSADNGARFRCVITNAFGFATSIEATLTVATPPVITTNPSNQSVVEGQSATFSVGATGAAPLTYQWQKNGVDIAGANSSTYNTPATTSADDGARFRCVVSNAFGNVPSAEATLTVNSQPRITTQPLDRTVAEGELVTFSIAASGSVPLSYQWQKNGVNIGLANSSTYTIANPTLADDQSNYRCLVTNAFGSVTSNSAVLTVTAAPTITSHPANLTVNPGQPATFQVVARGSAPLTYQWQRNSVNIPAANSADYTLADTSLNASGAKFKCVVSNAFGVVTSNEATLTVNAAPTITGQPADQTVAEGQPAAFTVVANGSGPLSYQWQRNGTNIPSANSSTYNIPASLFSDSGARFRCVVSNAFGSVISSEATLTVNSPPVITSQPSNQIVSEGQPASFQITASGSAPLSYQWQRNGINISGAISPTYSIPNPGLGDNGAKFRCLVSNAFGNISSLEATLTVNAAPTITTQPANQFVLEGQPATFSVAAAGSGPLSYQWQRNAVNIAGASSSTYVLANTSSSDHGAKFRCVVTNSFGAATSSEAILNVNSPPVITTQPSNQTVLEGQPATFSTAATGTGPLTYQWQRNAVNIGGATSSTYILANTSTSDNGAKFRCVVTNSFGTATSNEATLNVNSPPVITTQPSNQTVLEGQPATFSIAATGTGPLSYQWQRNATNITGANSSTYILANTSTSDNGAKFRCVVTNLFSAATSSEATLTVNSLPVITAQPSNQTVLEGQSATFTVAATGTGPLSYQWQRNATNITGANSSTYTLPSAAKADDGAKFRCVVSNSFGSDTSVDATLTVNAPPVISSQPTNQSVVEGQPVSFTIGATGSGPLTYQWQKNGANIPGATSSTVTIATTTFQDNGTVFRCVVSNSFGSVTSQAATLTVVAKAPVILVQEGTDLAIALDSVTMMREPFAVDSPSNFSLDHRTRLMLFVTDLELSAGESISAITAQAEDALQVAHPVTVEFVGRVPGFPTLMQLIIKLPDGLSANTDVLLSIKFHDQTSNRVRLRIQ